MLPPGSNCTTHSTIADPADFGESDRDTHGWKIYLPAAATILRHHQQFHASPRRAGVVNRGKLDLDDTGAGEPPRFG